MEKMKQKNEAAKAAAAEVSNNKDESKTPVKDTSEEKKESTPQQIKLSKNAKRKQQKKAEQESAEKLRNAIYEGINGYS